MPAVTRPEFAAYLNAQRQAQSVMDAEMLPHETEVARQLAAHRSVADALIAEVEADYNAAIRDVVVALSDLRQLSIARYETAMKPATDAYFAAASAARVDAVEPS